jgi:hypothetical protein
VDKLGAKNKNFHSTLAFFDKTCDKYRKKHWIFWILEVYQTFCIFSIFLVFQNSQIEVDFNQKKQKQPFLN